MKTYEEIENEKKEIFEYLFTVASYLSDLSKAFKITHNKTLASELEYVSTGLKKNINKLNDLATEELNLKINNINKQTSDYLNILTNELEKDLK